MEEGPADKLLFRRLSFSTPQAIILEQLYITKIEDTPLVNQSDSCDSYDINFGDW